TSFEQANLDRANSIAAEFRSEFQRRADDVVRKVDAIAAGETVQRIALELNRSVAPAEGAAPNSSGYPSEARALASQQQLDFLELVDHQGTILSSAQWQAKFGYPEPAIASSTAPAGAFL